MSPLFAEDVCWICMTPDVMELGDPGGNTFTDFVEGQGIVSTV